MGLPTVVANDEDLCSLVSMPLPPSKFPRLEALALVLRLRLEGPQLPTVGLLVVL